MLTIAHIIVTIIPIGAITDFTMNTFDILLGWTNANGNWRSHRIRKETNFPDVIPADLGRSEDIVSSGTDNKTGMHTIREVSPLVTKDTTKHNVHKITSV